MYSYRMVQGYRKLVIKEWFFSCWPKWDLRGCYFHAATFTLSPFHSLQPDVLKNWHGGDLPQGQDGQGSCTPCANPLPSYHHLISAHRGEAFSPSILLLPLWRQSPFPLSEKDSGPFSNNFHAVQRQTQDVKNGSEPELIYKTFLKTVISYRLVQVSRAITSVRWKSLFWMTTCCCLSHSCHFGLRKNIWVSAYASKSLFLLFCLAELHSFWEEKRWENSCINTWPGDSYGPEICWMVRPRAEWAGPTGSSTAESCHPHSAATE